MSCKRENHDELRQIMRYYRVTQADLERVTHRGNQYISFRMTGLYAWDLNDVYAIITYINSLADEKGGDAPRINDIQRFFPPLPHIRIMKGVLAS